MKKIIRKIVNCCIGLIASIGFICLVLVIFGIRPNVIISGSMEPVISTGSIAFVDIHSEFDEIKENDIIAFEQSGIQVLHRAIQIYPEGIETKGDANEISDGITTTKENFIGKYVFSVPFAGYLIIGNRNKIIALTVIIALIFLSFILDDE